MRSRQKCTLADGWCLVCYSNRKGRTAVIGHLFCGKWGPVRSRKKRWPVKRPDSSVTDGTSLGVPSDPSFQKNHPLLFEYLTTDTWDDGTVRERSTLLIFCEGQAFKLCLLDRALARKAFVTAQTLLDALRAVEKGLANGSLDWRPDAPWNGRGGRARKSP